MALVLKDRVKETTVTTGTGAVVLGGASTGYQSFSVIGDGNTTYYTITDGTSWEVGVGTYTAATLSLSRDTVLGSSNNNNPVDFLAGIKDVFVTYPAGKAATTDTTINIANKTSAYTVVAGDIGKVINCTTGTFSVSLTSAATLGSGFYCYVWNTGTGAITVDPDGSETLEGRTTIVLRAGEGFQIISDGTNWVFGNKRVMRGFAQNISVAPFVTASGSNSTAIGYTATASGTNSVAIGHTLTVASGVDAVSFGSFSTALGVGSVSFGYSYATGQYSFAASIGNSSSTYGSIGDNSVAIGYLGKSSGIYSVIVGGSANTASGNNSVAIGGASNTASGQYAYAFGQSCVASANNSFALGYSANSAIIGKHCYAAGSFGSNTVAQQGTFVFRESTFNATPEALTTNASSASTDNQLILQNNSAHAFTGLVVARQRALNGTASAAWKIEGLLRRESSSATTTLVASTVTAIDNTPSWGLALSADTTNGGLAITITGAASTSIRWVATVQTAEVVYA